MGMYALLTALTVGFSIENDFLFFLLSRELLSTLFFSRLRYMFADFYEFGFTVDSSYLRLGLATS